MENFITEIPQYDATATEQHVHIVLEGLAPGKIIAFRETPQNVSKSDAVVVAVTSAFDALVKLDSVIAGIRGSEESPASPMTIRQGCAAAHLRAVAAYTRARNAAKLASDALDAAESRFYLPTPRAGDDLVGALLDQELRTHWNSSDENLMGDITDGRQNQLLDAVARFPVGADAQLARNIRRGLVSVGSPETVGGFARAKERIQWAGSVLGLVESALLAGAAMTGPSPIADTEQAETVH